MLAFKDDRLPRRFWRKASVSTDTGCWIWNASQLPGGYGCFHNPGGSRVAHRAAYEALVGPVPNGFELDHLCRERLCVNPEHLEPVTHAENMARGVQANATHCQRGHEFTDDNIYWQGRGRWRACRSCRKEGRS